MTTSVIAALDIGGSKLAITLANASGPLIRLVQATCKSGTPDAIARQSLELLAVACQRLSIDFADVDHIGVSSCGPFDYHDSLLGLTPPNLCGGLAHDKNLPNDWTFIPLESVLREHFTTIHIDNDCVAALRGELSFGAAQNESNAIYVTWSTGIGVGLCVDGHVLRGKNGNAGHAGHLFVTDNDDALCGCGNVGDVEGLIAGNAMARRFGPQGYPDAASLFVAAYAGDTKVATIIDELCRVMGRALYNLIVTLDLQRISLGGSVFWHHRDFLLPKLRAQMTGKLPALTLGCELVPAGLGAQVGDFGALALVA